MPRTRLVLIAAALLALCLMPTRARCQCAEERWEMLAPPSSVSVSQAGLGILEVDLTGVVPGFGTSWTFGLAIDAGEAGGQSPLVVSRCAPPGTFDHFVARAPSGKWFWRHAGSDQEAHAIVESNGFVRVTFDDAPLGLQGRPWWLVVMTIEPECATCAVGNGVWYRAAWSFAGVVG